MLTLGLDIGTTTISAVIVRDGKVLESLTRPHDSFLNNTPAFERAQDVSVIQRIAMETVEVLQSKYIPERIGITGQQHGILYLDKAGKPVSPLYTWQDGRGNLPLGDGSYASYLSGKSGYALASGYGLVTHWYNQQNGLVPPNAVVLTTIHDYIAMLMCGAKRPVTEPSDAQSLGFFCLETGDFDKEALEKVGIDPAFLPKVVTRAFVGTTKDGIPVAVPIGDNPASFLGATDGQDAVLLNVGTGSQISVHTQSAVMLPGMETRPYPLGGYLQVGAALCGGRAWAMTEQFFSDAVYAFTGQRLALYEKLDMLLEQTPEGLHPVVDTAFEGTRQDPAKRGSITGICAENFTPGQFALGVLHGMIDELYAMYRSYLQAGLPAKTVMIGSGNGLRKNRHLQRIGSQTFGIALHMTDRTEEAAVGAAMFAALIG